MRDILGPGTILGYCTNVHPGTTYDGLIANLRTHVSVVKARVSPDAPMGIGLWIPADAARSICHDKRTCDLAECLHGLGLIAYTVNGFPYGDFHQKTVKHRVYQPDWSTTDRLEYTIDLADILARLLPPHTEGSISTLPLAWAHKKDPATDRFTHNLTATADHLHRIEQETGKLIHLDLEPEPGCTLQTSTDVVGFYQSHLNRTADPDRLRRHIRICHDVCHAAVMFEDQSDVLQRYRDAGIRVGKVQLSSAVSAKFDLQTNPDDLRRDLQALAEDRYLHQTVTRYPNGKTTFFDDLPDALIQPAATTGDEWRVHFHVPLFVESFGHLKTTHHAVTQCLAHIRPDDGINHFEVETYAWNVLPNQLRPDDLSAGIARELAWVADPANRTPSDRIS